MTGSPGKELAEEQICLEGSPLPLDLLFHSELSPFGLYQERISGLPLAELFAFSSWHAVALLVVMETSI